jgi:hypothetical protein
MMCLKLGLYPPRNPPIGFLVPRMYDEGGGGGGGGGGVATITGELTCFGVVTVAFVRRAILEDGLTTIEALRGESP